MKIKFPPFSLTVKKMAKRLNTISFRNVLKIITVQYWRFQFHNYSHLAKTLILVCWNRFAQPPTLIFRPDSAISSSVISFHSSSALDARSSSALNFLSSSAFILRVSSRRCFLSSALAVRSSDLWLRISWSPRFSRGFCISS